MPAMSQSAIEDFLQAPRHAILGTNTRNGPPQLTPVWYLYEAGRFYVGISRDTAKYRNLRRDPRISLCIDGGRDDPRTVMVYGVADLFAKDHPIQEPMRLRLIHHYISDPDAAAAYIETSKDWEHVLVVVTPTKLISQDFTA